MVGGPAGGDTSAVVPPHPAPPPSGYPYQHPYGHPYAPPGYAPPGWAPPWPVVTPPRVRHSPLGWTLVAASVLAIMVSGLVGAARLAGVAATQITWHTAEDALIPPAADASAGEWSAWARRSVASAITAQASALLLGDENMYLSMVDPVDDRLREDLQRRYDVLRHMGVGQWSQDLRATPAVTGEYSWHAEIGVDYCFGDPTCRPNHLEIGTDWRLDGERLVLTGVTPSGAEQAGPRPWEAGDLVVGTGARTVVATSARLDRRLEDTLAAAEAAAAVADTLARWGGSPSRYVVFLASSADWSTWYGFDQPDWAAGVYVNQTDNEVVVNAPVVPTGDTQELLTHELTHVATLAGGRDGLSSAVWWLVEGIADYAMMLNQSLGDYDAIPEVRKFVRDSWDGDPAIGQPAYGATTEEAAARYGVAFLAVWRMAESYGQDAMLDFFGKVVHDNIPLEDAAPAAYGESWDAVKADCEQFIRDV